MPRVRVLSEIPNHPFKPGDVVDAELVDLPHGRVAHGWCEWVDPPEPEDPTSPAPEQAQRRQPRTAARRDTRTPAGRSKAAPKPPGGKE